MFGPVSATRETASRVVRSANASTSPIQRVKTPVPRTFTGKLAWLGSMVGSVFGGKEDVADRGKYFRAHLETLQWQLLQNEAQATASWTEMQRLLALTNTQLETEEDAVVALVKDVPSRPSLYETPHIVPLDGPQQQSLDAVVKNALVEVQQAKDHKTAPESVFGVAQKGDAATRFETIGTLIDNWNKSVGKPGNEDRVRFNKSTAHYSADREGRNDDARLMLGPTAFSVPREALIGTLVHEGSHGALGTADLAYIGSAVFDKLTGTVLSLRNADHFKLALDVAAARSPAPTPRVAVHGAVVSIEDSLQQGAQLCAVQVRQGQAAHGLDHPALQRRNESSRHQPGRRP